MHRNTKTLSGFGGAAVVEVMKAGSRNVFKEFGLPNAGEHSAKAQLVYKIDTVLRDRKLKQVEAGKLFGIPRPDVSKMLVGSLGRTEERTLQIRLDGCDIVPSGVASYFCVNPKVPRGNRIGHVRGKSRMTAHDNAKEL